MKCPKSEIETVENSTSKMAGQQSVRNVSVYLTQKTHTSLLQLTVEFFLWTPGN